MTTMNDASYMSNGVNILKSDNTYYASNGKSYTLMGNALYASNGKNWISSDEIDDEAARTIIFSNN